MYDADELAKYSVDYVITPIVSQELPAYTLVDGGAKALNLAETLSAKSIIPMNNGGLDQSGILSALVEVGDQTAPIQDELVGFEWPITVKFLRDDLVDANIVPEIEPSRTCSTIVSTPSVETSLVKVLVTVPVPLVITNEPELAESKKSSATVVPELVQYKVVPLGTCVVLTV
jgi:hypothetical protein